MEKTAGDDSDALFFFPSCHGGQPCQVWYNPPTLETTGLFTERMDHFSRDGSGQGVPSDPAHPTRPVTAFLPDADSTCEISNTSRPDPTGPLDLENVLS